MSITWEVTVVRVTWKVMKVKLVRVTWQVTIASITSELTDVAIYGSDGAQVGLGTTSFRLKTHPIY